MSPAPACLYQETRLNLTPASPGSAVDVLVPSNGLFFSSRQSPKRRRLDGARVVFDENHFSKQYLASESAVHFRPQRVGSKKRTNPRAILWRILDERKLLELQAVDLYQDRTEKSEPLLTLRISFTNAIRPSSVVFVELETEDGSDAFQAFAVTQAGELFTMSLNKEIFANPGMTEDTGGWIKSSRPNAFGYRAPFKLLARNHKELWAALTDGALVRLDSEDGLTWHESYFTQGSWKTSMRDLIPWKANTSIAFEDLDLDPNIAVSFDLSPDDKHLWAVCLDHTLKSWNVETGKLVFIQDLAGDVTRDLEKPTEQRISPTRVQLLQILPATPDDQYMMVTFSPQKREFKFWVIKDMDATSSVAWEDASPDCTFIPPIEDFGNTTVWSLEAFHAEVAHSRRKAVCSLWILVRSGPTCNTYCTTFNLHDDSTATMRSWDDSWVAVNNGFNSTNSLKQNLQNPTDLDPFGSPNDGTGEVEQWLDFLFYPDRFTEQTLETALVVYCRSSSSFATAKRVTDEMSLKARICQVVGSSVRLEAADSDELAYGRYQQSLAAQWQIFYGVVKDLHSRREKVLCLSYDAEEKLPWLVLADFATPLRSCSQSEILWHNRLSFANPLDAKPGNILLSSLSDGSLSQLGQLFFALDVFRSSLSKTFLWKFASVVKSEVLESRKPQDVPGLIQTIYNSSEFSGQVSDDDYNNLTDALEPLGGFSMLNNDLMTGALDLLDERQKGRMHKKQLTRYGARVLIRGSQETLQLESDIILSLLLLVTFIAVELEDGGLPDSFDPATTFAVLAAKAKEHQFLSWLATSTISEANIVESKDTVRLERESTQSQRPQRLTVFESMFIGDWSTIREPPVSTLDLLTYCSRSWTFGLRLDEQYDNVTCHVLGTLLKKDNVKLAVECLQFVPETPWAEYLTGRLSLVLSEFTKAATHFKSAAQGLATGKFLVPADMDSAGVLDAMERTHLNVGFASFYQHVADLFEHAKATSYAGDFAQLALHELEQESKPVIIHRDLSQIFEEANGVDKNASLRTKLLAQLFQTSLHTFRFEVAFSALVQQKDIALRRSSLKILVQEILKTDHTSLLLNFPYPTDLAADADEHLAALAAKSSTSLSSHRLSPISLEADESQPSYKILYAFRLQRGDLRGAATCIWDSLQSLLKEQRNGLRGEDVDEEVEHMYLALINILSLMDNDQAWILPNPSGKEKRRVITLEDVRSKWQGELDRAADVAAGRFSFGLGTTAMEIEA